MKPLTDTEQSQSILQIESLKARIEKNRENINSSFALILRKSSSDWLLGI